MNPWIKVAQTSQIPKAGGGCVKVEQQQIAIIHGHNEQWYAIQNTCPHDQRNVLYKGLTGTQGDRPKIACPMHKHSFCLETGEHLGGNADWRLKQFPIKVEGDDLYIQLS